MGKMAGDQASDNRTGEIKTSSDDELDAFLNAASDNPASESYWRNAFRINRDMLPYRLFYILYPGAFTMIITFLPLQMKQLGLSASRIGIASAVRPFSGLVAVVIVVPLSIRLGKQRGIMLVLLVLMTMIGIIMATVRMPDEVPCDVVYERLVHLGMHLNRTTLNKDQMSDIVLFRRNIRPRGFSNDSLQGFEISEDVDVQSILSVDRSWQYNTSDLFRIFIALAVAGGLFEMGLLPTFACADAGTMINLKRCGKDLSDYGLFRCWGNLAYDLG